MTSLLLAAAVSYQVVSGLPLKHDGYVVERRGTGNGERVRFVVKAVRIGRSRRSSFPVDPFSSPIQRKPSR